MKWEMRILRRAGLMLGLVLFALLGLPLAHASDQDKDKEDLDSYKLRFDLYWFYSQPSGSFTSSGANGLGSFDLQKDIGFNSYSTFSGKMDWKFTRKNHLYFVATDFVQSKNFTAEPDHRVSRPDFQRGSVRRRRS